MKKIPNDLYKKIVQVSTQVKLDLRRKGIVVPIENADGSVSVGTYLIVKNSDGFYSILDKDDDVVVDQINLPQTAVVLANNLALGRYKDVNLINADKNYGYAAFDEMLHMRAVEKSNKRSLEYFDVMLTKGMLARAKKESYRSDIVRSFEKLLNQV
jgi:hypothetical protein